MSLIQINFGEEAFNSIYMPYFACPVRYLHIFGGGGSGKSVAVAQFLVIRLLLEPGHRFLLVRKVMRTIRKSQYQLIKDVISEWGLGHLIVARDSELEFYCPTTGGSIVSAGMDDPEKLKSIAGITGVWIEEATELAEEDFNQIDLRLRGKTPSFKQIIATYNPIDHGHWIKRRFHDKLPRNCRLLHTTYKDNRFLDADYVAMLKELERVDPVYYQIYALGLWATPSGLIYTNWTAYHDAPRRVDDVAYGLDFGYNNPTSLVKAEIYDKLELYASEVVYQTKLTNYELIERLKSEVTDRRAPIYCDAAEPDRIQELVDAGFNAIPAEKAVKAGIDYVKRFRLHIHDESDNLQREARAYKWKEDRAGNLLDEPVKFNDHALDALRYAVFTHGSKYWATTSEPAPLTVTLPRHNRRGSYLKGY